MIDIQRDLFRKLASGTDINVDAFPKLRVYLTEEQYENVAHKIKIIYSYLFSKEIVFALLSCSGEYYFMYTGLDKAFPKGDVEAVDNMVELSLYLIAEGPSCKIDVTKEQLEDKVFTDGNVESVEWDTTVGLFFPVIQTHVIKVPLGTTESEREFFLKTMATNALCINSQALVLSFNPQTIQCFIDVAQCGNSEIPIDNVLRSLGSNYWKFCYIDIYRCIERLLLIGWVQKYHQDAILKTLSPNDLYNCMEVTLKVQHHEWENIEYLFTMLPVSLTSMLDPLRNGENYHKYIYELRNKLVHYQKDEKEINAIKESDWNILIQFMLKATIELYQQLNTYVKLLPTL